MDQLLGATFPPLVWEESGEQTRCTSLHAADACEGIAGSSSGPCGATAAGYVTVRAPAASAKNQRQPSEGPANVDKESGRRLKRKADDTLPDIPAAKKAKVAAANDENMGRKLAKCGNKRSIKGRVSKPKPTPKARNGGKAGATSAHHLCLRLRRFC